MSLKAVKFPTCPKHLLQREHGEVVHTGQAAHSPKHVVSDAEHVVHLSSVLMYLFASIDSHSIQQVTTIYIPCQQTHKMHRPNTNIPKP